MASSSTRYLLRAREGDTNPSSAAVQRFNLREFKKHFKVVFINQEDNELEFDLIHIDFSLANAFRRLMLYDVPSMAIDKVVIADNTTLVFDEFLAHRLGLIPLKADPRLFEMKLDPNAEPTEQDTLEFTLKLKCDYNTEGNKDSSRVEDLYKNNNVYSKHIQWNPIGNQQDKFSEEDVGPVHDDILITKMKPRNELDMKLYAVKGIGRDHAKFSPVCTAHYRLMPEIHLTEEIEGKLAEKLKQCFCPGVIDIKEENGKRVAVINRKQQRYDISTKNFHKYPDLKDKVIESKILDHFMFHVESVGALKPDVIFEESVKILKNKCASLLDELKNI